MSFPCKQHLRVQVSCVCVLSHVSVCRATFLYLSIYSSSVKCQLGFEARRVSIDAVACEYLYAKKEQLQTLAHCRPPGELVICVC